MSFNYADYYSALIEWTEMHHYDHISVIIILFSIFPSLDMQKIVCVCHDIRTFSHSISKDIRTTLEAQIYASHAAQLKHFVDGTYSMENKHTC